MTSSLFRLLKNGVLTLSLCAGLSGVVFAQSSGSEGEFVIHNDTTRNVVVGFYTNDGSGWSANWLEEAMMPGEAFHAAFVADEGYCDQTFQVGWLGKDDSEVLDDPINIDICEASNVYLADNEIFFD